MGGAIRKDEERPAAGSSVHYRGDER